ncbi:MAG: tRNA pseudouridine(55) synthase TruB [Novosphingobium sp.]
MPHGWIILDKPPGLGSTQAVGAVKRVCREAGLGKVKVGHGGTLDPLATGVLPIALGEATKLCGRMLDARKAYAFTVRFGEQTDTLDLEGAVIATSPVRPTLAEVEAVLPHFTGPIAQVPPVYSAIKVDGARAYDLARAGETVELKSRRVTIHALTIAHMGKGEVTLIAHVSKGTYIRSLARDIALALGSVGQVTMLRRLKAGPFGIEQAISLDKLNEVGKGAPLENVLLPLEAGLVDIPALNLGPEQARAIRQGRVLAGLPHTDGLYWAKAGDVPVALVELFGGSATVVRGFNLPDVAE